MAYRPSRISVLFVFHVVSCSCFFCNISKPSLNNSKACLDAWKWAELESNSRTGLFDCPRIWKSTFHSPNWMPTIDSRAVRWKRILSAPLVTHLRPDSSPSPVLRPLCSHLPRCAPWRQGWLGFPSLTPSTPSSTSQPVRSLPLADPSSTSHPICSPPPALQGRSSVQIRVVLLPTSPSASFLRLAGIGFLRYSH